MPPNSLQETFSYVRRRADQLASFVYSPDVHEVLAEGNVHPTRALVIRAILATPGLPKFLHDRTHAAAYRRAGFDILGVGYHAVTINDGSSRVRKYYRHTAGLDEAAQRTQIEIWDAKQSYALEHLAEYAVAQSFAIEENPLNAKQSVITATQARIHATASVDIFHPESIPDLAQDFLTASRLMHASSETPVVPDLLGRDNAVIEVSTGAIKLIDPITLLGTDPVDEPGYQKVVRFLDTFSSKRS